MLDRLSRKIVLYMQTKPEMPSETVYDFYDDLDQIAEELSTDSESVRLAITYLESKGYIDIEGTIFFLSHRGLHSKEIALLDLLEFLRNSILVPIAVAFITSVLTTNLWPALWRWLQTMSAPPQ